MKLLKQIAIQFGVTFVALALLLGIGGPLFEHAPQVVKDFVHVTAISNEVGALPRDATLDGNADDVEIQALVSAFPSTGGKLILGAGNIRFNATVSRAINNVTIEGSGKGTYVYNNAATALFSAGAQTGWVFKDFRTDAGWLTIANDTRLENMWNVTTLIGGGVSTSTLRFAASDSSVANKAHADIVLTGANDQTLINSNLAALTNGAEFSFAPGTYHIDTLTKDAATTFYYGIGIPNNATSYEYNLIGEASMPSNALATLNSSGVLFTVSQAAINALGAGDTAVGIYQLSGGSQNTVRLENVSVRFPDNQRNHNHGIDLLNAGEIHLKHITLEGDDLPWDSLVLSTQADNIGFVSQASGRRNYSTDDVLAVGWGIGQVYASEHALVNEASSYRNNRSFQYGYASGTTVYAPSTFINCNDEWNKYGLLITSQVSSNTTLNLISYHIEEGSGNFTRTEGASEANPGYTHGTISFTKSTTMIGIVDYTFWKAGSGYNFETQASTRDRNEDSKVSVYLGSANQTINNGYTKMGLNTALFDVRGEFNLTSNNFTATASGYYQVTGNAQANGMTGGTDRIIACIYVNGQDIAEGVIAIAAANGYATSLVSKLIYLAAGSSVELYVYNSKAGTINLPLSVGPSAGLTNYLTVERVR